MAKGGFNGNMFIVRASKHIAAGIRIVLPSLTQGGIVFSTHYSGDWRPHLQVWLHDGILRKTSCSMKEPYMKQTQYTSYSLSINRDRINADTYHERAETANAARASLPRAASTLPPRDGCMMVVTGHRV